ncbi:hypothetical protein [Demequina zhanjiangensis]|uniref:Uncharacterized protein n=1 Tax=Demequina zhanjiangensis TaxID=3051659 RepID=A0ABT8FZI1_9MICO|nr:hypothetical protein [Demequina sp. SYSU T00b26]MDN4472301.1 hypothetical protein [Demequina sp. SYSU T00b26]
MPASAAQEPVSTRVVEYARDRAELPQHFGSWRDYAFSDMPPEEPVPGA